mmetsp:Transcript_388/g.900  ORF Transcript_388/g.900 Transcript_388/m.900 type:complete len:164 (-) Transcript_388:220-711(-)
MNLLMYMSPIATVILLVVSAIAEPTGIWDTIQLMRESTFFCWILVLNCVLAYCLNLLNFLVTRYTSALTLQVLGNGKGVVAAGVSIMIFQNPVTFMGMAGYVITIAGVVCYSATKKKTKGGGSHGVRSRSNTLNTQQQDQGSTSPLIHHSPGRKVSVGRDQKV